jgi:hypothetical protein
MTAIFAFVSADVAFVAGDSLRSYAIWGAARAHKVHIWSDRIVIGQCGDGKFLSELIEEVRTKQPFLEAIYPNQPDDERLLQSLAKFQPAHYANASKAFSSLASGSAHITGAILVASTADSFGPERISRFDFATGAYGRVPCPVAAEGAAPAQFLANAQAKLVARQALECPFAIDEWAADCLRDAITAHPLKVGWPLDLILARPSQCGRLTVTREMTGPSFTAGIPEFEL